MSIQDRTPAAARPAADPAIDPAREPSAPGATATPRWTGEKASAFLQALSRHGKVGRAARSVGMSRQAAYRLKARAPTFAEYWEHAMQVAADGRKRASSRQPVHPLLQRDSSGRQR